MTCEDLEPEVEARPPDLGGLIALSVQAATVLGALLLAGLLILLAGLIRPVHAHPGRLDGAGCHTVRQDYLYADGRLLRAGERHCHRGLGAMRLDDQERLVEEDWTAEDQREFCRDRERGALSGQTSRGIQWHVEFDVTDKLAACRAADALRGSGG